MNSTASRSAFRPTISLADLVGIAALTAICIAFFWRMVFTDQILPRGDTFAYFYPYWAYRSEIMAAGKIPLWNPYLFMGAPFLANSQAGVLYPFNWPLTWLDAPSAAKAAIVMHIVIAAWGMFWLSRRALKLSVIGAVFAGAIFALGGYLTSQVEHINQLQGLTWLPWLVWLWDETLHGSIKSAPLWMALVLAVQVLAGHTQTAFITVVGLLIWGAWHILGAWLDLRKSDPGEARNLRRVLPLGRPLVVLIAVGVGAAALAAAQILPTLELTRLSNRSGGLPLLEAISFSLRPQLLGRAMLPQFARPSLFSEYVAYIGVAALILALIGAWISRTDWRLLGLTVMVAASFFLAFGAYNPIYWGLVKVVPGFDLFRAPARWLALWALASAGLAGVGLDWLATEARHTQVKPRLIAALGAVVGILILLAFLAPLSGAEVAGATSPAVAEIAAWIIVAIMAAACIVCIRRAGPASTRYAVASLAALSLVELFVASGAEPLNRLTTPAAWSSQRPAISTILSGNRDLTPPPRFLSLSDTRFDPGDLHEIEASYKSYLNEDQIYDYVIATKEKEILAPNLPMYWHAPAMDGFDGGILPTRDYTRFTSFFVDPDRLAPDGRLRENLKSVPDLAWLRIVNVQWIITDKVFDAWIEGVYYDLQFAERRDAAVPDPIDAYPADAFDATGLGLVGHIETAQPLTDGTQIGTLAIYPTGADDQNAIILPLIVDASQPGAIGALHGSRPKPAGNFTPDQPDVAEFSTLVSWDDAHPIEKVRVTVVSSFPGVLVMRGMTLIDSRTAAFSAMTLSAGHTLSLANSGDVKVYQYGGALPRAYLVCDPVVVGTPEEAWAAMQTIPSTGKAVIEDPASDRVACTAADPGAVDVLEYEPERVVMSAHVAGDGAYLVLSDAWYPGWEAAVDGQTVEILRANGLFRAIPVTRGDHSVVFSYRSRPFEVGALVSGISVIALLAVLTIPRLRRRPGRPATG